MSRILAIAGRDLRAYLLSPAGYIIAALFLLFVGCFFIRDTFSQGQPASLRPVFERGIWALLLICPAISMRAISEERRLGTYEVLMTCPVSETEVILGKFAAGMALLAVILAPTVLHVLALELYGRPDYGELLSGYLGMLLAGSAYLASGILVSTLTNSQVVALLVTVFGWLFLSVGAKVLPGYLPEPWAHRVLAVDPDGRLKDFALGLIDTSNVVYFLSIAVVFLVVAVKSLEVRK